MANTYAQAWGIVRNHCPLIPVTMAQYFVQQAWEYICDRRSSWSFLRAESEFLINTASTGTVNVTRGSTAVSGGTMAYATTDVGRQFRVGTSSPVYTISAATPSSYTLERVYGDTTATATSATVIDAFLTAPADFKRFIAVLDTHNNWQLHVDITEDELNARDAQRSAQGTPWAVVSRRPSVLTATLNQYQFELWPYQPSQANYPYFYYKSPATLTSSSTFPDIIELSVIVDLALSECAKWPGLEDRKNPYFNLALAKMKEDDANKKLDRIEVLDEEIYMTWLETVSWINRFTFAPIDSKYFQSHDIGAGAPWGATWPH